MTPRKPANVSFGDWVEGQIRDAQRRGVFDDLPGAGQPLTGLPVADDHLSWVANKLRRENLPVAAILPPSLALPKEIEELPGRLARQRSEAQVREILDELNDRILKAHRRPQEGPPLLVMLQDVDKWVGAWRKATEQTRAEQAAGRTARQAAQSARATSPQDASVRTQPRRWRPVRWRPTRRWRVIGR
ncbi:DUF1992 domain-containing protein [Jatrophihabitans telluris]|uniref:DUF1992 domain-containing protein n=1 Tax=Jatrophihabitans telluris TaxID=2038343 RepID=A0ABY4R6V6_9ACTN|nr:DUF1992 domain-containing protein [Jatrophihabitans telluris]UQX90219.1 DUF1992 domain-containing protein [Jatrophihabitans telluris]